MSGPGPEQGQGSIQAALARQAALRALEEATEALEPEEATAEPVERPDIAEAAKAYRAERERKERVAGPVRDTVAGPVREPRQGNGTAVELLPAEPVSVLAGRQAPDRQFIDGASLLPLRNVVLLGGDGGTGKSLLALQLMLACTLGRSWIGIEVASGPVVYLSCEDDHDEVHARVAEICQAEAIPLAEAFTANVIYMAGKDAVLAYERHGRLVTSPLFKRLTATLDAIKPMLLILDNLADIFAGNENDRPLVKHFVGLLHGLAITHDCTVLLLGHPSLSGRASGTGESGSTAWSNSVRSRLYLHRPDGLDADDDARILEVKKANYSASGQRIDLSWKHGRFIRENPKGPFDRISVHDLDRVQELFASGRWRVNEQAVDWGGYAVAQLLDFDVGRGTAAILRTTEQNRNRHDIRAYLAAWVRSGTIHSIQGVGPDRKPTLYYSNRKEEQHE